MEKKDNSGVLFKNDKKETGNHPDYKGNITVNGQDYCLSDKLFSGESGCHGQQLSDKHGRSEYPT
jgi:hypothetical protein